MKTPDNSIDFTPTKLENVVVTNPAERAQELAAMDGRYTVESTPRDPSPSDSERAKALEASLAGKQNVEGNAPHQEVPEAQSPAQSPTNINKVDDFIARYGSSDIQRNGRNGLEIGKSEVALDIYSNAPSTGLMAAAGALVVGAPVLTGALVAASASAAFFALPAVAAGVVAYGGYKIFKTWKAKRAFKSMFGKSVEDQLGHQ
jgi:hypothetical protein